MTLRLQSGENLLAMRSESLRGSAWRLGWCALAGLAGLAMALMPALQAWSAAAQWAAVAGAAWSEAERAGGRVWLTDRRVIVQTGLLQGRSHMPLRLLGPFSMRGPLRDGDGPAWLVASTPDGAVLSALILADRPGAFLACAERARVAAAKRARAERMEG